MPEPFYKLQKEEINLMFTGEQLSLFGSLDIPEIKAIFSPSEYRYRKIKLPKKK